MEPLEPGSAPLYSTKPTGCFSLKALFRTGAGSSLRHNTPLVLRKSRQVSESDKFEVLVTDSHNKLPERHQRQSKIKQTLPDVVANVADSQHQHSHSTSHHKHRLKEEFEELEAENERLKAIFDLHSISYNEQSSSKSRRNSDPEPGGKNSSVSEVFAGDNSQQTKRSSMSSESSEGRSSTKYEDVKAKKLEHNKKTKNARIREADLAAGEKSKRRSPSGESGGASRRTVKDRGRSKDTRNPPEVRSAVLTSADVAQTLLSHQPRDKRGCVTSVASGGSGSNSLPSSPGSVRRGSGGSSGGHGGSLTNIREAERRGSRGIIKPSVQRRVRVSEEDHLHDKVSYTNYDFYDTSSRPGLVFIGSSGHVIAECPGHPTNTRIIVRTVREGGETEETTDICDEEEELDEEKIYAFQKLRTISLKLEKLKG